MDKDRNLVSRIKDSKNIAIAIDGPAGAGKSTIAKKIAEKLDIIYLDTGAMYRALAYYFVENNIDYSDLNKVDCYLDDFDLKIRFSDNIQRMIVGNEDITDFIRTSIISKAASDVAKIPNVRLKLVKIQRKFSEKHSIVMDGRDIGTFVLPNADLKFFLTASIEERALRRWKEVSAKDGDIKLSDVRKDIEIRDNQDTKRSFAPLIPAEDGEIIDTTNKSIDEVVQIIFSRIVDYIGG